MRQRGFTLLEVMVAVAILGLGLTAILSAQAGAFSSAAHARNLSLATGLARCKMSELEQKIAKDGLPAMDESDSGPCCEGDESPIQCTWKIEKPVLPEPKFGDLNLDTELGDIGSLKNLSGGSSGSGAPGGGPLKPGDMAQALASGASALGAVGGDGKPGDFAQMLAGAQGGEGGGAASGGVGGLIDMAVQAIYPSLKPVFEASARRLSVKLTWREGLREHDLEIAQWVTIPQMGAPPPADPEGNSTSSSASTGSGDPNDPTTNPLDNVKGTP